MFVDWDKGRLLPSWRSLPRSGMNNVAVGETHGSGHQ